MSTIVLRLVKGVPLTNAELDDNFSNLNTDKLEAGTTATLTNKTINLSSNTFVATSAQMATAVSDKTGSGALVFATSPTFVTPALGTPSSGTVTNLTGTASININGTVGATTATTGAFTTLTTSSTVTLNGGTANGVAFLNGSKVLTTGSTLAFLNGNFLVGNVVAPSPSDIPSIEMESAALFGQREFIFACNAYYQSGWKYQGTGFATRYYLDRTNGDHLWQGANSGSAGAGIGFATRMTLTASGVLQLTNNLQLPNNLQFTGTGNRITGDFSNATVANRVAFQTSTVNGRTSIGLLPNGTEVRSDLILYNSSDTVNNSFLDIFCSDTQYAFSGNKGGTGAYLPMIFYTGGSERVRIQTSGNVGIGTISPTELLDVNGNLAITGSSRRITGNFGSGTVDTRIFFQSSSSNTQTNIVAVENGTTLTGNGAAQLVVADSAYTTGTNYVSGNVALIKNTDFRISSNAVGTAAYLPMAFYTGGSERVRIDNSGNVTVGPIATLPNSTFAANAGVTARTAAASAITPYLQLYNGNSGTDLKTWRLGGQGDGSLSFEAVNDAYTVGSVKMTLTNAGNVGIGTSFPAAPLEISGTGTTSIITATSAASYSVLRLRNTGASGKSYEIAVAGNTVGGVGNSLYFYDGTATAVRLLIDTAGNVGIGTSSPTSKLHVSGGRTDLTANSETFALGIRYNSSGGLYYIGATNSATPDMVFSQVGGSERMRISNAGDVGIGTPTTTNGNLTIQKASATTDGPVLTLWNSNPSGGNTCGYLRFFSNTTVRAQIHSVVDSGSPFHGNLIFSTGENTLSERLRIDYLGRLSTAGGQYLTAYNQSNSFTPNSTNWIRLCTLSATNQGQMVDFTFSIPGQHILFRVKFSKTTAGGFGGGGILDVELLGAYVYSNYTPFDWRLSDGGTNGPSHIDIRFPNNAGEAIGSIVNVISSYTNDVARHATFPMTNLGSGNTGGSYSNMGSAGAGGFTKQWFRMTGTKYVFYDNNMTITSGATPPTA